MHRLWHKHFRLPVPVLLLVLAVPSVSLEGQSPQRGGAADLRLRDSLGAPLQEAHRFGATVSRVLVDVIVTDVDGNFVPDLATQDFVLYEDGEAQEIIDGQLVDRAAGEVHSLLGDDSMRSVGEAAVVHRIRAAAGAAGGAAGEGANAGAGGEGGADTAGAGESERDAFSAGDLGAVIFLVDAPSLSARSRARFADAWNDLLEQTDDPRVPRAAYMVDNVGRLQELAPLGHDLQALRAAADTIRAAPFFGDMTRQRLIELSTSGHLAAAKARSFEGQERSRSLATYELLTSFADALWTRSGRTAVVWVSTGIKLMQGGPYTTLLALMGDGNNLSAFSLDPMIKAAQEELHRAANGSNVSFYTVDPSLLIESRGVDVEVGNSAAAELLGTPEVMQSIDGLRDALRSAAAETGGKSFIRATDIQMVLEEIEADTSRFYLLTYAPPAPDGDGAYHTIRVEVRREDVDVRARGGYIDHAPEDRARRLISAALALPGSVTDLPVEVEVFRSRRTDAPNVLLAVAVEGSEVGVMLTDQGDRRVSLDIHAVAVQGDRVVDESHEQLTARSGADGTADADSDNRLTPTLVGYMAYQREWTLAPGAYTLKVAAFDNVTGRVGAASIDVEVPDESDDWGLNDPLLVTVDDAGRVHPVVLGRVVPGEALAAFVEVYNGVSPILSGQVMFEPDDRQTQRGAKLFPVALHRAAVGIHSGAVPLPPSMPPGHYIVQLVVTDATAEQHRVVRLPIEIVASPQR